MNSRVFGKDRDNNIRIEEKATTHSDSPLRSLPRLHFASVGDRPLVCSLQKQLGRLRVTLVA